MERSKSKIKKFAVLVIILAATMAAGLYFGSVKSLDKEIIVGLRLPRVLAAALAGAAFSVSGLMLQTVTGNSLCAPNIIGVNAGAGLGIMIVLCYFPAAWYLTGPAAFLCAFLASFSVILIAKNGGGEISRSSIILAGVAVGAAANAAISFLTLRFPDAASGYCSFTQGGFRGVTLGEIKLPALVIAVSVIICILISDEAKLLLLGDGIASSMGVKVSKVRTTCIILASLLAASAVSFAGLLGFVGLAVPHICRKIFGEDIKTNIFSCILLGPSLTVLSDLLGRVLFAPSELPAGILTAAIGAPFFIYLIIKRRGRVER